MQNINLLYNPSTRLRNIPKSLNLLNGSKPGSGSSSGSFLSSWKDKFPILDPGSSFVTKWNSIFLVACMATLFLDPLYFFVPQEWGTALLGPNIALAIFVTFLRIIADGFYLFHILTKFRIAYINPNSRVFGKGELVRDPSLIARRYIRTDFIMDVAAMLPLPQIIIWFVGPALLDTSTSIAHALCTVVLIQYIPRMLVMFPLNRKMINTTGVIASTPWSGAAYNMLLFVLASHVLGATWYLWSIERMTTCWITECKKERGCKNIYFDAATMLDLDRHRWMNSTRVLVNCDPSNKQIDFQFGMFADAFLDDVPAWRTGFIQSYFYCLWWGMRSLCSYGQSIQTSTYVGETLFCSFICVMGLGLFSHLVGQVQNYLQSIMVRIEEWRIKRRDTEEWMNHRQLPEELKERIRRFVQYKWLATRGVDEEDILQSLPLDLRREIQRHLCLGLVRRVPFFEQMDDQLLDAICERLVSSLSTKDTYIIREGDPVSEMVFVIRGQLESSTTYGGRSGFYNSITLRPGDFCGEELLTWALLPASTHNLPSSTRTVKAVTEVEAFALQADDLKYVAAQFKRLHSKKLQHAFRYYSHQWRMWGACFMQAAWRRYTKRKMAEELARQESSFYHYYAQQERGMDGASGSESQPLMVDFQGNRDAGSSMEDPDSGNAQPLGATILASKFAANSRRGATARKVKIVDPSDEDLKMPKMFKPQDPDLMSDM
ncbi:hypothetical protein V2J09_005389 [Rumex salicifolius]